MTGEPSEKRSDPIWFAKPLSSVIANGGQVPYSQEGNLHHEVELGLLWGKSVRNLTEADDWKSMIKGIFVGIDFTDRLYQNRAKENSAPWTLSKGQDCFSGVSDIYTGKIDDL